MPPVDSADLAEAENAWAVQQQLVSQVAERVRVRSIHYALLEPGPNDPADAILHAPDLDSEGVTQRSREAVAALYAEMPMPDLFAQPHRALRIEDVLGWDAWMRSTAYKEYFRSWGSARQLVIGLSHTSGRPRAFMALSRTETEDAWTRSEEQSLLQLRDTVERALAPFEIVSDWSQSVSDILEDLAATLPVPALLMGAHGRIAWMNREAELRLGVFGVSFAGQTFYSNRTEALERIVDLVARELRRPGTWLQEPMTKSFPGLFPGESLVIRRIERADAPPRVLVCFHAGSPTLVVLPPMTNRARDFPA